MSAEDVIRAWKADDEDDDDKDEGEKAPENPAGQELSDEELQQAAGGMNCEDDTCNNSCVEGTWRI